MSYKAWSEVYSFFFFLNYKYSRKSGAAKKGNHKILEKMIQDDRLIKENQGYIYNCVQSDDPTILTKYNLIKNIEISREGMNEACSLQREKLFDYFLSREENIYDDGLFGSCFSGNIDFIQRLIEKGAQNWRQACKRIFFFFFDWI